MDDNRGWIKLHRKIYDSAVWTKETPFDERSAWVDLLMMVNHEERSLMINGDELVVHVGQRFTSIRKLAERWHWSRNRVSRYLDALTRHGMLHRDATHNGTLITIENYSLYQSRRDIKWDTNGATNGTPTEPHTEPRSKHKQELKNDKNDKNDKKIKPDGLEGWQ